jgi:hypothetical protein
MRAKEQVPNHSDSVVPTSALDLHGQRQRKKGRFEGLMYAVPLGAFLYVIMHDIFPGFAGIALVVVPVLAGIFISQLMAD